MKNKKLMAALIAAVLAAIGVFAQMQGESIDPLVLDAVGDAVTAAVESQEEPAVDEDTGETKQGLTLSAEGGSVKAKGK